MASSSSFTSDSQYRSRWKYDVFLNFRGVDTRRIFTGHLYEGLKNRGIFTFQDDKRLENGDSIPEELLKAIEESQVALVIFSKNYATSRWCLNELVKIMECKEENGQIVIPVFYDVYPSEVRKQTKSFAKAFAKHEKKYNNDIEGMQKVKGWRTALSDAADLKGYDISNGIESDYIQHIVDQISVLCKGSLSYIKNLVGIDTHLKNIRSLLAELQMSGVLIVGIWGMPGVGKTTIARAIFDRLSYQFEAVCFLADIKENKCGMHSLQNILLFELLKEKDNCVNNKEDGRCLLARRLRFKKVLVVLDDIDHIDQLDLSLSSLRHLWTETKHLPFLQKLDLRDSRSLMQTPDFTWMPNLKYLDLSFCRNLEEVHHSLEYSRELIELNLYNCGRLKRFPCVNVESLDYMDLEFCSSLEKFPKIIGRMKPELKIKTGLSGIRDYP